MKINIYRDLKRGIKRKNGNIFEKKYI